jgi:flagellar basal-body rod protein FlgG
MYKGLYIAASGAMTKYANLTFHARNIANSDTAGYKREGVVFRSFALDSIMPVSERVLRDPTPIVTTDYSPGEIVSTGNPLDVALKGDGFFALEGNIYTRRGDFTINNEGYLITKTGKKVLGTDGNPIELPPGSAEITQKGEVIVNGNTVGELMIVDFPRPYNLFKLGESMYTPAAGVMPENIQAEVIPGAIEGSNVKAIYEMIEMMETMREFEAYQKMIRAFDESSQKAINEIGRI